MCTVIIINRNRAVAIAAVHRESNWCAWKSLKKKKEKWKDDDGHKMARKKNKETRFNAKIVQHKIWIVCSVRPVSENTLKTTIFDILSIGARHLRFSRVFASIETRATVYAQICKMRNSCDRKICIEWRNEVFKRFIYRPFVFNCDENEVAWINRATKYYSGTVGFQALVLAARCYRYYASTQANF